MKAMFDSPQVEETFGKASVHAGADQEELKEKQDKDSSLSSDENSEDDEDPLKVDERQKSDIIRTFALNQISNIPAMFRGQLTPELLNEIIHFLVDLNYNFEKEGDS